MLGNSRFITLDELNQGLGLSLNSRQFRTIQGQTSLKQYTEEQIIPPKSQVPPYHLQNTNFLNSIPKSNGKGPGQLDPPF